MKEVLFIAGNSGSGKSYLTKELLKNYPDKYYKLEQYTTRPRRHSSENEYYYVNQSHFDIIKDRLIATTEVNGNHYGTIPTLEEGKIAIIIVNALGLENGIEYCDRYNNSIGEEAIKHRSIFLVNNTPFEVREDFRDTDKESEEILKVLNNILSDEEYEIVNNDSTSPISVEKLNDIITNKF